MISDKGFTPGSFNLETLHQMQRDESEISCDKLALMFGYPRGYAEAEKALEAEGWYYSIGHAAWFRRQVGFV